VAIVAAGAAAGSAQAPDSPRPAPAQTAAPKSQDDSAYRGRIDLRAVRVLRLDATLQKMAGPEFLKRAKEPLAVEAQTARPLPSTPRDTSAILILNGERVADTWAILPDKLVAFVDRSALRQTNTAEAAWSGAEQTSRSTKALTFQAEPVK
jgi:hypothetical protein